MSVSMSVRIKFSFLPPFLRFFVSSRSSVSSILSCSRNAATINRRSRDILIRDTQRGFVSSALDRRHSFAVRKFSFEPRVFVNYANYAITRPRIERNERSYRTVSRSLALSRDSTWKKKFRAYCCVAGVDIPQECNTSS